MSKKTRLIAVVLPLLVLFACVSHLPQDDVFQNENTPIDGHPKPR